MKKVLLLLLCATVLVSCADDKRYAPKEGRVAIFTAEAPTVAKGAVQPAKTIQVNDWHNAFYNAKNNRPNLKSVAPEKEKWQEKAGKKALKNRLLPTPQTDKNNVYVLDGGYTLTKLDKENGEQIWQKQLAEDKQGLSLSLTDKNLFALSLDGTLTALDKKGKQLWQKKFNLATRAPLIATNEKVYLITAHNQFIVLSAKDGAELWRYQTSETDTGLSFMAPPAKVGEIVVVPFTTGEVMAFDEPTGMLLWVQMMVGNRPQDLTEIAQIAAAPVIDDQTIFLTGNANLIGAYELKTGETKWTAALASRLTPIVSGNTLFLMTTDNKLVALNKETGKQFWQKEFEPAEAWHSLSFTNAELLLSDGERLVYVNPKDGTETKSYRVRTHAEPVFSAGHLILLDKEAELTLY